MGKNHRSTATCWDSEIEILESCGKLKDDYEIILEPVVRIKIKTLMNKYKSIEWLAYLIGEIDHENQNIYVEDLTIPKQKVTAGSVTDITRPDGSFIGVIHSHHDMGAQFSHTDDEYINQNNDLSIVISHKEITAQLRLKTPCGAYAIVNPTISFEAGGTINKDMFEEELENIQEYVYVSKGRYPYYGSSYPYGYNRKNIIKYYEDQYQELDGLDSLELQEDEKLFDDNFDPEEEQKEFVFSDEDGDIIDTSLPYYIDGDGVWWDDDGNEIDPMTLEKIKMN